MLDVSEILDLQSLKTDLEACSFFLSRGLILYIQLLIQNVHNILLKSQNQMNDFTDNKT